MRVISVLARVPTILKHSVSNILNISELKRPILKCALRSAIATIAAGVGLSHPAHAYFSTIDTGDLVAPQKFQAILEPQLILNRYDGLNAIARLDTGLGENSAVRGLLGFGKVDFQVGGFYKYIPFPDTPNQPAIGGEAGVIFARVGGETEFSIRVHPLISKRFETEIGDVSPYVSIPLGITSRSGNSSNGGGTFVPVQLVGGAQLQPLNTPNIAYFAEIGINVAKSFSYISAAIAFRFDEETIHRR